MFRTITTTFASVVVVGCVTVPAPYDFDNSMYFPYQGDIVWPAIMEVFAENHLNIQTLERASGIVTGEYRGPPAPEGAYDCRGGVLLQPIRDTLSYIVFMREAPNGTTVSVTVLVDRLTTSSWDGTLKILNCVSTGLLEATLLARISEKVGACP